jgi:hypothetical protein
MNKELGMNFISQTDFGEYSFNDSMSSDLASFMPLMKLLMGTWKGYGS